mmetsp:Transcript_2029/g.2917  ORF Transcript_2029/g.2917 Transcript_2029/m.2917 type:complete len:291 (-) Transcript_2029:721-1593(-)
MIMEGRKRKIITILLLISMLMFMMIMSGGTIILYATTIKSMIITKGNKQQIKIKETINKKELEREELINLNFDHQKIVLKLDTKMNKKGKKNQEEDQEKKGLLKNKVWKPKETAIYLNMMEQIDNIWEIGTKYGWNMINAASIVKNIKAYPQQKKYCRRLKETIKANQNKKADIKLECEKEFERIERCEEGKTCAVVIRKPIKKMKENIQEIIKSYCYGQIDINNKKTEKQLKNMKKQMMMKTTIYSYKKKKAININDVQQGDTIIILPTKSTCARTLKRKVRDILMYIN